KAPGALVSVVVPCTGQLEYTRLCVQSLLRHSRPPVELLFLDVAALDGTADYLAGVADAAPVRVQVVRAATDVDLPAACRQLLGAARGAFLGLLNTDALVPPGWLEQLTALADLDARVGLVGAMCNQAEPPQRVADLPYHLRRGADGRLDVEPVERFAETWR